jgi:cbb3-type cytochrome oxidase maturation protein
VPVAESHDVDILFLLIPLSAVLVLLIIAVFGWAVHRGQFEDLEREGERILLADPGSVDDDQVKSNLPLQQSRNSET